MKKDLQRAALLINHFWKPNIIDAFNKEKNQ